jgi:hypothetical protein
MSPRDVATSRFIQFLNEPFASTAEASAPASDLGVVRPADAPYDHLGSRLGT